MDAIGSLSLLKDKKPSDSFVLVVQLITPLYGALRQLSLYQHLILVRDVCFLPYPTLPSPPLPCPTLPPRACLQAGIQATDMFLLLLLLLLVPWLSADRLSTW